MDRLALAFARGRAAHPTLDLSQEAFERFFERTVTQRTAPAIDSLPIEDLYLACACAEDVAGAAAVFERALGRIVRRAVARVLPTAAERDEAEQRTRHHLLVRGDDGPPKIANYRGEGPLAGWVSIAAIRLAVSMARSASAERQLRMKAGGEAAGVSPEHLFIKAEVRKEFEYAVEDALAHLADRERLVLRLYLVSGMTLAAIGKAFGVTQQTVSRWLAKARSDVLEVVERRLGERLKVPKDEVASIARLLGSGIDISISRLLSAK